MSIAAVAWCLDHSPATGTDLLVQIALADFADEHGLSWPSIRRLAHRSRVSERTARRSLRNLEGIGQLVTEISRDGYRSSRYRLTFADPLPIPAAPPRGVKLTGGRSDRADTHVPRGGTPVSADPSVEPSRTPPTPREAGGGPLEVNACDKHHRPRRGCTACATPPPPPVPGWCGECSDDRHRQVPYADGVEIPVTQAEAWEHAWGPCPRCHPSSSRRSA